MASYTRRNEMYDYTVYREDTGELVGSAHTDSDAYDLGAEQANRTGSNVLVKFRGTPHMQLRPFRCTS